MVIIQLYKELGLIEANNLRIENIEKTQNGNLDTIFKCLKHALRAGDRDKIKWFVQEVLFFEEVTQDSIDSLVDTFFKVKEDKQVLFVNMLKESYIIRGTRGYLFTFIPILRRVGLN